MRYSFMYGTSIYNVETNIENPEVAELIKILDISIYAGKRGGFTPDMKLIKFDLNNNILEVTKVV